MPIRIRTLAVTPVSLPGGPGVGFRRQGIAQGEGAQILPDRLVAGDLSRGDALPLCSWPAAAAPEPLAALAGSPSEGPC